jgi:lipid A 3-O-deacylase
MVLKKLLVGNIKLKNTLALNFNAEYNKFLIKDTSNQYDISWKIQEKIGTVFTNIIAGFLTRAEFKPLQSLANSIAYNTTINAANRSYFKAL